MKINYASKEYLNYHRVNSTASTLENYKRIMSSFELAFKEREIESISSNDICQFLDSTLLKCKQSTRHLHFTQLKAFFNFCINGMGLSIPNPCKNTLLGKTYSIPKCKHRATFSKEVVDEIIYKITKPRDRLLLELQARSGLRIGEVLKLRPCDIEGRKMILRSPKSGSEAEVAFMPTPVAEKLNLYIAQKGIQPEQTIFPLTYSGARDIIQRAGRRVGVSINPHDLRRHSATYASRNGIPLEVISKVILRHQDLKTTQIYLGKISDTEALHWVDSLHGK